MDNVDNHLVHIDVTQIAKWVYKQFEAGNEDSEKIGDFLYPPFERFYMRWIDEGVRLDANIFCTSKGDGYHEIALSRFDQGQITNESIEYLVICSLDLHGYENVVAVQFLFDKNRNCLSGNRFMYHINKKLKGVNYIDDEFDLLVNELAYIYKRTMSLIHCKNIELKDEPLTRQQRRRKERKNEVIYKVLAVKSSDKSTRYLEHGHSGNKHAYHLCRGHFKTYTDDAPLFGRFTGTYWWPAHVRGSKEYGEVVKDYEVVD